jgi:hypothetical protein
LWMTRFDPEELRKTEEDNDLAKLHPVMARIATTIHSPVGFLALDAGVVLAFDKETMATEFPGIILSIPCL